jgi:addiction module HigA family antidote
MTDNERWTPTWVVPPGEILAEALEERGMTQAELGRRMARPLKTISEIATGKAAITPDTAIQLERALGISVATWLGLESRYREAQARERDMVDLERHRAWLTQFPVRDLVARRIIGRDSNGPERAAELLSFFGVSSPAGWDQYWGQVVASYRMSDRLRVSPYAVAVWVREAERQASGVELPAFDPAQVRAVVGELRSLSRAVVVGGAIDRARELLRSGGVGLLLIEGFSGAPASGAVRWARENPWIALTLRQRTDDQLWFSLFHEIGHVLERRSHRGLVEELEDRELPLDDERAANAFAREALLPQAHLDRWLESGPIDRRAIKDFAAAQEVAPGIVVGRLQRDGRVGPGQFNDLKRRLDAPPGATRAGRGS